jgi:hypothetical protein
MMQFAADDDDQRKPYSTVNERTTPIAADVDLKNH